MAEDGGDGWGGALLAGGAALLGGLGSYKSAKDSNETNLELGREQMQFQERMSNTSYQRAIEDMKRAGINPMLSAKVGGASTPPGSMPQIQNAAGQGISSAMQGAQIVGEAQRISQNQAATEQIKAATDKIRSETLDKEFNTAKAKTEWDLLLQDLAKKHPEIKKTWYDAYSTEARFDAMNQGEGKGFKAEVDKIMSEARIRGHQEAGAKAESNFYKSEYGEKSPYIKSIMDVLKGIVSARQGMR